VIRHEPFARSPVTFIDTVTDTFFRPLPEVGFAHISIRDERHNVAVDPLTTWADENIAP
jgi:hypothetical protein